MATARPGDLQPRLLRLSDGRLVEVPVARWCGPCDEADAALLARVRGPVLDLGCGPGRLTAALHARGEDVLGVELLPGVPVLAHAAGAPVLQADALGPLPRTGAWGTVLLADGNVGLGGDAGRVLRRAAALLAPGGRVLLELSPDPDPAPAAAQRVQARLEGLGTTSRWFSWALLGPAALPRAAAAVGLAVVERWEVDGRPFAALSGHDEGTTGV